MAPLKVIFQPKRVPFFARVNELRGGLPEPQGPEGPEASLAEVGSTGREFFQLLLDGNWLAAVYPNADEAEHRIVFVSFLRGRELGNGGPWHRCPFYVTLRWVPLV